MVCVCPPSADSGSRNPVAAAGVHRPRGRRAGGARGGSAAERASGCQNAAGHRGQGTKDRGGVTFPASLAAAGLVRALSHRPAAPSSSRRIGRPLPAGGLVLPPERAASASLHLSRLPSPKTDPGSWELWSPARRPRRAGGQARRQSDEWRLTARWALGRAAQGRGESAPKPPNALSESPPRSGKGPVLALSCRSGVIK